MKTKTEVRQYAIEEFVTGILDFPFEATFEIIEDSTESTDFEIMVSNPTNDTIFYINVRVYEDYKFRIVKGEDTMPLKTSAHFFNYILAEIVLTQKEV